MHPILPLRTLFLGAAIGLLAGCAAPGWNWPGSAPPSPPAVVVIAPPPGPVTIEDRCNAEAWQQRLEVRGDPELGFGMAYRRCMRAMVAGGDPSRAPALAAPAGMRAAPMAQPPLPPRPYRN